MTARQKNQDGGEGNAKKQATPTTALPKKVQEVVARSSRNVVYSREGRVIASRLGKVGAKRKNEQLINWW
ncbi:MAG: hypothetical protein LUD39_04920 [Opitutae bacterium]|nr:hypothetical protein [Opitutae bacterium]MCD8299080.1 hypothetical protein [Opitutae bacterium]